ncbi:MAG: trigger factor [Raoultibacter sp.]
MKVTQKKVDNNTVLLEAVATPQEVDQAFDFAAIGFAQQMGLTPEQGKTLPQILEEKLGIKDVDAVVCAQVAEFLVPFAIDKKSIMPAFPPTPEGMGTPKRGAEFPFTIEVMLRPEFSLSSYDPVAITAAPFAVDPAEVEAEFTRIGESYAEFVADEPRPVGANDSCLIAIEAKLNGEIMEGLTTDGRTYTAGAQLMPEEFDKNVVGMEVGQTKEFSFQGPSFDGKDGQDTVECKVTVKEIQKKAIPAITDAWVKKTLPMFDDVASLKKNIEEHIAQVRGEDYKMYQQSLAMTELAKRFEGHIDDPIYEAMHANQLKQLQQQVQQQGMTMDQFMEQQGGQQQFSMMMMLQVRQMLTQGYALDALFKHEKMTLTEEDIDATCKTVNPQQPALLKEEMAKTGRMFALREIAERQKAAAWLLDHAAVSIEEPKQA